MLLHIQYKKKLLLYACYRKETETRGRRNQDKKDFRFRDVYI